MFELVEQSIIDIQDSEILNNILKKQRSIDELEIIKQEIQKHNTINKTVKVQYTTKSKLNKLTDKTKNLFVFGKVDLQSLVIADLLIL